MRFMVGVARLKLATPASQNKWVTVTLHLDFIKFFSKWSNMWSNRFLTKISTKQYHRGDVL